MKLIMFLIININLFGQFYSQIGQDKFVFEHFFSNKRNGTFLDIGAHDGVSMSNTYFFEKEMGWTGICFEPMAEFFKKLQKSRNCILVHGAASSKSEQFRDFLVVHGPSNMLSGFYDTMSSNHKKRIQNELKIFGGYSKIEKIRCYNVNEVLEQNKISHIDFLSIDTEGSEYEILENFDFNKCHVDVITMENNYDTNLTILMMEKKGFRLFKKLDWDLIFVNQDFIN